MELIIVVLPSGNMWRWGVDASSPLFPFVLADGDRRTPPLLLHFQNCPGF